jgi:DNA-binding CsgD family transcriptional regulator
VLAQAELVERTGELEAIVEGLELAERGLGRLLIVSGPAGIGKSALLQASGERAAARGFRVLAASGSEMERKFPFGVVRQLYGSLVSERTKPGEARTPIAAVFGAPGRVLAADVSFQTLDGLYWLVADLAQEGPLVILVDDAQWADEPSLQHLGYLSRRLRAMDVLVVSASRFGESPPAALEDLSQRSAATIEPRALGIGGVEKLIQRALGNPPAAEYVQACLDQTGGYPLYVIELLRSAREQGVEPNETAANEVESLDAEGLGRHVWRRIEAIGAEGEVVAGLLAILGDQAEVGRIARIGELEPARVLEVVDRLIAQGVVREDGGLRCAHPIVAKAIESRLSATKLDGWYRAAAHLLLGEGVDIREVSGYLLKCQPRGEEWIVERLRELAKVALASGAPGPAKVALVRALAEPPGEEVLVPLLQELALAEDASGEPTEALEHLAEALRRSEDPRQSVEIAIAQGQILALLNRYEEAVAALEIGAEKIEGIDPDLQRRVETDRIACLLVSQRVRESDLRSLGAGWAEFPDGAGGMAILTAQAMHAVLRSRPAPEGAALAERALLTGGLSDGGLNIEIWTLANWLLIFNDRADLAQSLTEGALVRVRREGHVRRIYALETALSSAALHRGDIPTAVSAAHGALSVTDPGPQVSWAHAFLALALLEAGDLGAVERALSAAEPEHWSEEAGGSHGLHFARAQLRIAQGRLDEAARDLDLLINRSDAYPAGLRGLDDLWRWVGAVLAHHRGETERARSVALEELKYARGLASSGYLGRVLRIAALVSGGETEIELLGESEKRLRLSGCRLEQARSLVALGAARRRRGERVAAREPLREGLDLAYRCGGGAVVSQALAELRAAGARPRRMVLEGPDALTPREARMAQLAAHGRSNREIAQELYVTLATVEGTLWRAYAKLDISGQGARQALPNALGSLYETPESNDAEE